MTERQILICGSVSARGMGQNNAQAMKFSNGKAAGSDKVVFVAAGKG